MSEDFYRSIVEAAREGVAVIDVDGKVTFANQRAEELLGYEPGEPVGLAVSDLVAVEDQAALAEMPERLHRGESEQSELRILHKDGDVLWASVKSSPLCDDAGRYAGGLVLFNDVTDRKRAEASLQQSEARFKGIFEHAAVGIVLVDLDSRLVEVNPTFCAMLGYEASELTGRTVADISHPDDWADADAERSQLLAGEIDSREVEKRYLHRDGHAVYAHTSVAVVRDPDGAPRYLTAVCRDMSTEVEALGRLHRSEDTLRLVANNAQDLIFRYRVAPDPGFEYVSPALKKLYGYSLADFPRGTDPLRRILSDHDSDAVVAAARSGSGIPVLAPVRHKDGRLIWSEAHVNMVCDTTGREVAMEGIVRDVSERKALEEQLVHQALHDPLTGLGNRTLFHDRVGQAIARLGRSSSLVALLYVDLDHFKLVNDVLGHAVGDELLQAVAERLVLAARSNDSVVRLGGDEFVILCEGLAEEEEAIGIARRVMDQFATPFSIRDRELSVSASIGVAASPVDSAEDLLRNADASMYRAKQLGGARVEVFIPGIYKEPDVPREGIGGHDHQVEPPPSRGSS